MAKLDPFFRLMVDTQASDLHLSAGNPPLLRVHGELQRVKYKVLEEDELREMLYEIAPEEIIKKFEEEGEVDFGYEVSGLARFRVNYFRQRRGIAAAFRLIPNKIKTIEELGLPSLLNKLALLPRGLVLVTGPTGSGKSTTLAAIIDYANRMRYDHIITIEDPIEFVHEPKNCLINQREIGVHSKLFACLDKRRDLMNFIFSYKISYSRGGNHYFSCNYSSWFVNSFKHSLRNNCP